MFRIAMIKELKELNDSAQSTEDSLDVLINFLSDEGSEVFLIEEDFFNRKEDYIILKKHSVDKIDKLKIEIRSDEHPPAHFHVILAEYKASYDILNCNKMNGNIPRKYEKKIILWYKYGGKEKLISKWNSTRPESCGVGII